MIFKPSEDMLDQLSDANFQGGGHADSWQEEWRHFFHPTQDAYVDNADAIMLDENKIQNINQETEEIKAPDLSELLKSAESHQAGNENESKTDEATPYDLSRYEEDKKEEWWLEASVDKSNEIENIVEDENRLTDAERISMVWQIEWSVHSDLDLLVDERWKNIIDKYTKIHRIVFRWWIYWFSAIIGLVLWLFFHVSANNSGDFEIIKKDSIKSWWVDEMSDSILGDIKAQWVSIDTILAYWSARVNKSTFQSKSNLISYNGVILPQQVSINTNSDIFSMDDFYNQNFSKEDLKNLLHTLVVNDSIYSRVKDLPSPQDNRREWQMLDGWLIKWFSLWCMDTHKALDFFCDKFLDIFYEYGKYYDLYGYSSELLSLVRDLRRQNKNIEPVCKMINEYVQHSWVGPSDNLTLIMDYCSKEDQNFYKKMINFIEVEKDLSQPELSDKVYEDPDLNAYKLLSAQQNVYRILNGTSLNKRYISSYLSFVQALINKDKWTSTYISPIYKDMTYIFNRDELTDRLLSKWQLSSDLKSQIDHINKGNSLYDYASLINLVTTKSIIESDSDFEWYDVQIFTAEDLFAQYYLMTERLKIRSVNVLSEDRIRVQSEIFSDKIQAAAWDSIKATIVLYRKDNVLNVESINIARQSELSEVLNIRARDEISFYAMLNYIDDQIGFRYVGASDQNKTVLTLCDELQEREDIDVNLCNDSDIRLLIDGVEYRFKMQKGILNSFEISNSQIDTNIRDKLSTMMFTRENTPVIIKSILSYKEEKGDGDENLENKLQAVDQFRIYMKLIPEVYDIEWISDEFIVEFKLWEIDLQARYNINTYQLTNISYINCDKSMEISWLVIELSSNNMDNLTELLNNPRVYLMRANPDIYRNYLKMCE